MMPRGSKPGRRRDLDLLRVFVVVGLVFFHSARIFDTGGFYVKNDPTSDLVTVVIVFMAMWGMPLLFVVAGMGIWYSLATRTAAEFVRERLRRLLVPLVFGVLVIVPPQVWLRSRRDPTYEESYWQFLPAFFDVQLTPGDFPFIIGAAPEVGLFEPAHLWFVVVLLAFSVLLLPLMVWLRGAAGSRVIDRLAGRSDALWVWVVAGLSFGILDAVFGSDEALAGWSRYSYAVFIVYGYVLATDDRFARALRRHRRSALILGVATFVAVGALYAPAQAMEGANPALDYDLGSVTMRTLKGVSGWLWLVAILGFAAGAEKQARATTETTRGVGALDRVGAYASEAVLPIYVLHQTVIVVVGSYVVGWPMSALLKYMTISLSSALVILGIYEVGVRRVGPARFLFGMKAPRS